MESQDRSSSASDSQPQLPENRPFPFGSSYGGMGMLPSVLGKGFGWPGAGGSWPGLKLPGVLPGLGGLSGQGMGGTMPGMSGIIPGMGGLLPGLGGQIPSLGSVPALKAMKGGSYPWSAVAAGSAIPGVHPSAEAPPGGWPQGAYPQGSYPPGAYPQGGLTQGGFPPGAYPQGGLPQGSPPGAYPQGGLPQGGFPPGGYPQGGLPQGNPPGAYPIGTFPQGGSPPGWHPPGPYPPASLQAGMAPSAAPGQPIPVPPSLSGMPLPNTGAGQPAAPLPGGLPFPAAGGNQAAPGGAGLPFAPEAATPESIAAWQGIPAGFNESSITNLIQSVDPNWVSQWQQYQGWPFASPPFPVVPDSQSAQDGNAGEWPAEAAAALASACSGDLQNPACLQACLAGMMVRWQLQERQIAQLLLYLRDVENRLQQAENQPTYTIEKLEYNFDQLKVEQLDGTLNIGMTAPSEAQMQEFGQVSVPQKVVKGGAPIYPLPIPSSANKGPNAPAPPSAPGLPQAPPGFSVPPGQQGSILPTSNSNVSSTSVGTTVIPGQPPIPGHGPVFPSTSLAGSSIELPGAPPPGGTLAQPGFSAPPAGAAAPSFGNASGTGLAPGLGGNFSVPGQNPSFPGISQPGGLQPGPGAGTAPGLTNFSGSFGTPASSLVPGFSAAPSAAGAIPPLPAIIPPGEGSPTPVNVPPFNTRHAGYSDVKAAVDAYLNTLAQDVMSRAAKELKVQLDPYHQKMVIEDVRRQIPDRIRHYMADEESKQASLPPERRLEERYLLRKASERTIRDAELALKAYVDNLARHPKG